MKTKIKRHSRSVLSVILAICILISCMMVGLIATDAARVTGGDDALGENEYYLLMGSDTSPSNWTRYVQSSTLSFTITPQNLGKTSFGTGNYYIGISSSSSISKMWSQGGSAAVGTKTNVNAGTQDYNIDSTTYHYVWFACTNGDASSVTVTVSHDDSENKTTYNISASSAPAPVTTSWTVVGSSAQLFGTAWAPTATANDMTTTDNNVYTWSKSNVALPAGDIEYKVAKNHAWTEAYPSSNAKENVATAGNYNVTVTFNATSHAVNMEITSAVVPEYTLTVGSPEHADLSVTYDGTTMTEGQSSSEVPEGATITVSVTPDSGYRCTGVTTSPETTVTGSGTSWSFKMPASDTTVNATTDTATLRRVYFNNYYSRYSMVSAYAWNGTADQSSITEEPLGTWPGKTMTRIDNTNTWYIDLYDSTQYIIFRGDDGYNTYVDTDNYKHITIPWSTQSYAPKYTAGSTKSTPTVGGTWGTYVARSNDYTVSPGTTITNNSDIFSAIHATFYDYYVDGEFNGKWLEDIGDDQYNMGNYDKDPYENFNAALSAYATGKSTTYPLYFGNLSVSNNDTLVKDYYNFYRNNNDSGNLHPNSSAVYGLAGSSLANGAIQYADGADMPMFDEDFLSGENSKNKALATILRSNNFPVRKDSVTSLKKIYLDTNGKWVNGVADLNTYNYFAHYYMSADNTVTKDVAFTHSSGNNFNASIPTGFDKVVIVAMPSNATSINWDNELAQTDNLDVPTTKATSKFTVSGDATTSEKKLKGSWGNNSSAETGTHTYYEYDSTNGKDNAFITDITQGPDADNRTAQINYYDSDDGVYVKSSGGNKGFFPFDYNNVIAATTYPTSTIYVDVSSVSNAEYYGAYLWHSGQDGTWTTLTQHSGTTYKFDNSEGYDYVILTRGSTAENAKSFNNCYNRTGDVTIPTGSDNKTTIKLTYNSSTYGGKGMDWSHQETSGLQPNPKTNGYAQTDHTAHDQGFGVKLEIPFTLGANGLNEDGTAQTFDFSGDDDLWVYVDDKLVLDLGGAHAATQGSINFNTLKATATSVVAASNSDSAVNGASRTVDVAIDNSEAKKNVVHTMKIYYMERGMFDSNLKFGFSFHAIPNLLNVDKKVRTANVNSGFFDATAANTATNNGGTAYKNDQGKNMTRFEHTYQSDYVSTDTGVTVPSGDTLKTENFTVTHGSTTPPKDTSSVSYSIGSTPYTETVSGSGYTFDYDLYNNLVASFVGQYREGQTVTLKETIPTNSLYNYDQSLAVTNVSEGDATITATPDGSGGYSFVMPNTSGSGLDDLRVRARFTNQMKTHTLTISKDLNVSETEANQAEFPIQVLFKFGNYDYTAYPLYCVVDGKNAKMSDDGKITLRKGHTVTINGIPENAQVQIKEILADNANYAYNSTTVTGEKDDSETTIPYGATFTMGSGDVNAVVKNTKGALTITHDLHSATEGFGTCYASAKVKNGNSDVKTYAETDGELEIEPTYIKHTSEYNLEITLRTVPANGATVMDSFWEQVTSDTIDQLLAGNNMLGLNATVEVDIAHNTAKITFPINKLFNSSQEQTVTVMPFFSKLATWKWRMIFDVSSYRDLYNNMQYATDTVPFTEAEWAKMTSTTSGDNEEGQTVTNIPDFSTNDERTNFIYNHAPYENGFKNTMTWRTNLKSTTHEEKDMVIGIDESTRTIKYSVKPDVSDNDPVYVTFELPYSTGYDKDMVADKNGDGDVVKTDDVTYGTHTDSWKTSYEGHYTINSKYVQAPDKIKISGSKTPTDDRVYKYFSYWEVYTQPTDKTSRKLYTKCYSRNFNLTLYQDSIMKAVYNNNTYVSPSEMALKDDTAAAGNGTASINFMENSRTQWTADSDESQITKGTASNVPTSYHNGGDRIYTDFLISYTYKDLQLNTSTQTGLTPGLIVETVADLPIYDGLYKEQSQSWYEAEHSSSENVTAIRDFIEDTDSKSSGNLLKSEFTLDQLDNKNRINYYYSLPNISHTTQDPTVRKNKVYRAYTYLRDNSGAVVLSNPVYFAIYDIATIANYADGRGYDGVTN